MTNLTNDVPVTEREYRKTATIRATQWHKMGDHPAVVPHQLDEGGSNGLGWINTLEGGHIVTPGDWIATGVKGEHWPIKPDIFAASYEPAARLTSQPAQSDPVAIVAGKRLTIKPGAPEIALLCRAIFRSTFADDEEEAVVNAKYGEWPEDQAKAIRAAKFVLRALGGNGAVVRALSTSTAPQPDRESVRQEVINTPETADFMAGVPIEAAHQRQRWPSDHDAGKTAFDWFWLVGYLAQKAASAQVAGDTEKALHHTISTAAALANWHAHISGADTSMRPGIEPPLSHPTTDTQSDAVPDDVRKLVIAARNLAFSDHRPAGAPETQAEVELIELFAELDRASEAFADRIEWYEAADTGREA